MKNAKIIMIGLCICTSVSYCYGQTDTCTTVKHRSLTITPLGDTVSIPARGWNIVSSSSTEFDVLPNNGWYIHPSYGPHPNADNGFSSDAKYWDLENGILKLHLENDTFIYQNPPDTFNYTSAILVNNAKAMSYGYYESKVKLPLDIDLCSSLWCFHGAPPNYREIDILEFFTVNMQTNIYHRYQVNPFYGGKIYTDQDLFNANDWYIFGFEWLPKTYRLYINHHYVGEFDADTECVEDYISPIQYWRLWIVNWVNHSSSGPFPKTLQCDYIRVYTLNKDSIDQDFYDHWANYDYGVWRTVKLGDAYSAMINDQGTHTVWATDGITLVKGFTVTAGTAFETKIYKQ
ncbi:MAG: family 16 glycosylhydrolase [Bacteroidales bacterium]